MPYLYGSFGAPENLKFNVESVHFSLFWQAEDCPVSFL